MTVQETRLRISARPLWETPGVDTDPESQACAESMRAIIAEEIQVRLDLQDRAIDDPTWADRIAVQAVDALLDAFLIRPRPSD